MKRHEYTFSVPEPVIHLSKNREDYAVRVKYYFSLSHPGLELVRIEGRKAVLVKKE